MNLVSLLKLQFVLPHLISLKCIHHNKFISLNFYLLADTCFYTLTHVDFDTNFIILKIFRRSNELGNAGLRITQQL
jgi:hypothetical protein